MVILGGKPPGRLTEQHDVFFGVAAQLKDLVPGMHTFWPEMDGALHIDSWRTVSRVADYQVSILPKEEAPITENKLFFINLGGYKPGDMEEYHYKHLVVATDIGQAARLAKKTSFWREHDASHIDDKFLVDVDDIYEVSDLLGTAFKEKFVLDISAHHLEEPDKLHVGYLKLSKLLKQP